MNIKSFEFNPVRENTYILYDETKECVIIDPGTFFPEEEKILLDFIEENSLIVKHILNTHLHFDHVFGSSFVEEKFNLKTQAHQADEFLLEKMPQQLSMFGFDSQMKLPSIGKYLKNGDIVKFGNQELYILEVPGHSPGSIAFYNEKAKCVISGDALFNLSIGRTDLPMGNMSQLLYAIEVQLFSLPPETKVYPGHGPSTTIGNEIKNNPFFKKK